MNNVKIFLLTIISFFSVGLHFSAMAMEISEKGKEIVSVTYQSWQQAINDLLHNKENWSRTGPTSVWMNNAAEIAVRDAKSNQTTNRALMKDLDTAVFTHYTGLSESDRAFMGDVIRMDFKIKLDQELERQKKEGPFKGSSRLVQEQLLKEQFERDEQEREKKGEEERAKDEQAIRTAAWRRAFEEQESMSQEELLKLRMKQKQTNIKDSIEHIKQSPLFEQFKQLLTLDSVGKGWFRAPLQRWKDNVVQAAFELLKPIKDTYGSVDDRVINLVVKQIDEAMTNYAHTKSYFPDWTLIAMDRKEISDKITTLINYNPSRRIESTFVNKLLMPTKTGEQELYEQAIKKSQQHDVERAQEKELKEFTQTFENIAHGEVNTENILKIDRKEQDEQTEYEKLDAQRIYWIFNPTKTYYDLNPITAEKIVDEAVSLIKEKNVPLKTIENMMNQQLQEARKGKSPKFRSASGLGIIKAIKMKLES